MAGASDVEASVVNGVSEAKGRAELGVRARGVGGGV